MWDGLDESRAAIAGKTPIRVRAVTRATAIKAIPPITATIMLAVNASMVLCPSVTAASLPIETIAQRTFQHEITDYGDDATHYRRQMLAALNLRCFR